MVEVTEDHSLLLADGRLIKPMELDCGDCLLTFPDNMLMESLWDDSELRWRNHIPISDKKNGIEYAKMFWILRRQYPRLRFVLEEDFVSFDVENKNEIPSGYVYRIVKTSDQEEQIVYDMETLEGRFHCGIGSLVVKNTDSIYCHFLKNPDPAQIWNLAKSIETEFIRLFPRPMKLVFEEKIYKTFLILTKKRYMAYTCNEDGSLDKDLTIRGVLLARRDNCRWIRQIYEHVVRIIMDRKPEKSILEFVNEGVLSLFQWKDFRVSDFVVSKLVGKDYNLRPLPLDIKKFQKRLQDLQIKGPPISTIERIEQYNQWISSDDPLKYCKESWFEHYVERCQPSHVQLAIKMRRRGLPVEAGSRIEYLAVEVEDNPLKSKLNEKIEDPAYFCTHCDLLRLDRFYYVQSLAKPMDQLLEIVYQRKDFTKRLYQIHVQYKKVLMQIEEKFRPVLHFQGDPPPSNIPVTSKKKTSRPTTTKKKTTQKSIYDFLP